MVSKWKVTVMFSKSFLALSLLITLQTINLPLMGAEAPADVITSIPLMEHTDKVYSAAFSPDGTRIVTASNDGTARVWRDTRTHDAAVQTVRALAAGLHPRLGHASPIQLIGQYGLRQICNYLPHDSFGPIVPAEAPAAAAAHEEVLVNTDEPVSIEQQNADAQPEAINDQPTNDNDTAVHNAQVQDNHSIVHT